MNSLLPAHLRTALQAMVGFMQWSTGGEASGGVPDRYGDLLLHLLGFLAQEMEQQTQGVFSVREAEFALLQARRDFQRRPALCLVMCRATRRRQAQVSLLGDDDELYFVPSSSGLSKGLSLQKVDRE